MSGQAWKPGDVAMVNGRVCMRLDDDSWEHGDRSAFRFQDHEDDLDVRPLVVIDPEDAEQVGRLMLLFACNRWGSINLDLLPGIVSEAQAALREFALPTPPKPDEPGALFAQVEDADGATWYRSAEQNSVWRRVYRGNRNGRYVGCDSSPRAWSEINAVRVLSHGVSPEEAS